MTEYLSKFLPRLLQFSESLDRKELFIDQPWVLLDQSRNKQQYIFKRDGKLIISLNGNVQVGTWEYLPTVGSLLIDRGYEKVLFNQGFINKGVLVLKKDSFFDEPFLLVNQNIIPDLNVEQYLKSLLASKNARSTFELMDGGFLEYDGQIAAKGAAVYAAGRPAHSGSYMSKSGRMKIHVENGKISRIAYLTKYMTDRGQITIVQRHREIFTVGDSVIKFSADAPTGMYKIREHGVTEIWVEEGRIKRIKSENLFDLQSIILAVLAMLVIIGVLLLN